MAIRFYSFTFYPMFGLDKLCQDPKNSDLANLTTFPSKSDVILVSAQVPLVLTLGLWTLGLRTWA